MPRTATGPPTRKTAPHQKCSSTAPPASGPPATAMPAVPAHTPMAWPRSRGGTPVGRAAGGGRDVGDGGGGGGGDGGAADAQARTPADQLDRAVAERREHRAESEDA